MRDPVLGTWSSAGGVDLVAIAPAGTSYTGGTLGLELNYFIPDTIIDPNTGTDVPQQFDAKHTGNVRFADGDDPQNAAFTLDPAPVKIEYETVQIQKEVAGATPNALDPANPNGVRSGDVLTYTLTVQVGDFYGIRNAVVTDALPDGIEFNAGSMRVTSVNVNGQTISSPISVTPTVTRCGQLSMCKAMKTPQPSMWIRARPASRSVATASRCCSSTSATPLPVRPAVTQASMAPMPATCWAMPSAAQAARA